MGYDMYIVHADPTKPNPDLPRGQGYFRLNIWCMGICRTIMGALGLLDDDATHGPWVNEEDHPNSGKVDEYGDPIKADSYHLAKRAMLSAPSHNAGQVPAYKFCSNDGWVVNPTECNAIADAVDKAIVNWTPLTHHGWSDRVEMPTPPEWLSEWSAFCRNASHHGGFEVF